jgi:hypothetical protein
MKKSGFGGGGNLKVYFVTCARMRIRGPPILTIL